MEIILGNKPPQAQDNIEHVGKMCQSEFFLVNGMTRPDIPMNITLEHMIIKVAVELSIRVLIVRTGGLELFESVSMH